MSLDNGRHSLSVPEHDEEAAKRYNNRELSWLGFNERVLQEAQNPSHPLLERLRFLSISGDNLDEFYMVRVAGLVGQVGQGVEERSADGRTPAQQLSAIEQRVSELTSEQQRVWQELRAMLAENDLWVKTVDELSQDALAWLDNHFMTQIFPVLTPQASFPVYPQ
jgi:polyphosphate kinase